MNHPGKSWGYNQPPCGTMPDAGAVAHLGIVSAFVFNQQCSSTITDLVMNNVPANRVVTSTADLEWVPARPGVNLRTTGTALSTGRTTGVGQFYLNCQRPPLTGVAGFSVFLIIQQESALPDTDDILGKWDNVTGTVQHFLRRNGTNMQWFVRDSADANQASPDFATSYINDGLAHMVVLTADGTNLNAYVDGVLRSSTALTGPYIPSDTTGWGIGFGRFGINSDAQVSFQMVVYCNRALTYGEVARLQVEPYWWMQNIPKRYTVSVAAVGGQKQFRNANLDGLGSSGPLFSNPLGA